MKTAIKKLPKKERDKLKAKKREENVKFRTKKKEYYSKVDEKISALNGEIATLKTEVNKLQKQLKVKVDIEQDLEQLRVTNKKLVTVNNELAISTASSLNCVKEYVKEFNRCRKDRTIPEKP